MEKTKEYNQITIDVTELGLFSGLYESIWLNSDMDIDEVMELADMLGVDCYDINVTIDTQEYLEAIGELYCEMFCNELDSVGLFRVDSLYSPKWYNFDTDHIVITWDSETLTVEEMESKLKELTADNDNRDDWTIEMELWDYRGSEIYSNMVRYTYNDKPLWFGMDSNDIAQVKG
ncbi:hypothetical protein WRP3_031 [Lactococcus phage WRP3]|uniref:Uncharacterized protein n=1 Tax=Lactococcus phage WRP3 TaxID=1560313 RepID=A0A0D3MSQ9_9CAUD|nr:hypothetical protein ACQ37_gp031 [Lactococcus phage WRP3]AIX12534.1 hypothetical protein WRP3_031 [Lactococcus phage WRP3]